MSTRQDKLSQLEADLDESSRLLARADAEFEMLNALAAGLLGDRLAQMQRYPAVDLTLSENAARAQQAR